MPKLVLLRQIPAMRKKFTFKTKRETCPATMAQIQQNIILKKYAYIYLKNESKNLHEKQKKISNSQPKMGIFETPCYSVENLYTSKKLILDLSKNMI